MKVMMVGSIEPDIDWTSLDLDGRMVVILSAESVDEVRAAGGLLFQQVAIVASGATPSEGEAK